MVVSIWKLPRPNEALVLHWGFCLLYVEPHFDSPRLIFLTQSFY